MRVAVAALVWSPTLMRLEGKSNTVYGYKRAKFTRSIMTTVPAHGDLSPRARIYFFVIVVHTT